MVVELFDDLVFSILSLLPVKSLMRFKCVCKSWKALQSDPQFNARHLNRRKNKGSLDLGTPNPSILLKNKYHYRTPLYEPFISFLSNESMEVQVIERVFLPFPAKYDSVLIYGPCNGILCLRFCFRDEHGHVTHSDRDIALWNPATREFNLLPPSNATVGFPTVSRYIGFCFDPKSDDYRVVLIQIFEPSNNYVVELYSLRSNCWQLIKATFPLNFEIAYFTTFSTTCLNGVHYWRQSSCEIISFDFVEQVFGLIEIPQNICNTGVTSVTVLNDSLALICAKRVLHHGLDLGVSQHVFNIWVMDKERTWTLQIKLEFGYASNLHHPTMFNELVGLWSNDKFFFYDYDGDLHLYDSRTDESKALEIHYSGDTYFHHLVDIKFFHHITARQMVVYQESLVSVKGEIEPLLPAYGSR